MRHFCQERGGAPGSGAVAHPGGRGQGPQDRGARVGAAGEELQGRGVGAAAEVGVVVVCTLYIAYEVTTVYKVAILKPQSP